jgi:CubicO group peptidase (beta-lactamase class C family)
MPPLALSLALFLAARAAHSSGSRAPASAAPRDTVATALGARLDSALRAAARGGFSGVVRVERDGTLLLAKGYGLANRERRVPFERTTLVQIGSNTKDFTLVELLRLQARGRLSLRDSLGRFFPAAPPDKRGITLQQLVDHRAGFPIGLGGDFDTLSRSRFLDLAFATPLRVPPGTRRVYSNAGYSLLAAVIEQVTGRSYDEQVHDDILVPLGLANTGSLLPGVDPHRVAHGYRGGEDRGSILEKPHAPDGPYWNLRGNGGMVSTVDDMHAFYRALFEGERLVTRAARGDRFDPDAPVGLAGSDLVSFFLFERMPRARVEIIVASNSAESRAPAVREVIARVLGLEPASATRSDAPAAPPPGAKSPAPDAAALVHEVLDAVNGGDRAVLVRLVESRFDRDGEPPVEARVERLRTMHERLGRLTATAMWLADDGAVQVAVATAAEGPATFLFDLAPGTPLRVRAIRVMVGG